MASAVIGALRVNLGMDSAAFRRGARESETRLQSMQRRFASAGASMQRAGSRLSLGLTLPLAAFARQSVEAARVQEQAVAQVEAALASMGDAAGFTLNQLQDMASGLQNTSLYGDEDILQKVTANLLTFGNISGEVFERTQQAALDMSTRLGQDLQSSAVMLGKALNDPIAGLSALSRVGVQFSDEQRDVIRAMVETGNVAAAQALILDELERQYAGAAEAAASTDSGRITQAMNAIGDAMEDIGAIILPIIAEIADKIRGWAEAFQALSPETQTMVVKVAALTAAIGPLLIAAGLVVSSLGKLLPIIAALASPFTLAAAAIAAVTYAIWRNWDAIKEWLGVAVQFGADVVEGIGRAFADGVAYIQTKLGEIWDGIVGVVSEWAGYFYDKGVEIIDRLIDGIRSRLPTLQNLMRGLRNSAASGIGGSLGVDIDGGATGYDEGVSAEDVMGLYSGGGGDQGRAYGEDFAGGVRDALEIRSPSRVMRRIGEFVTMGLGLGIGSTVQNVTGPMGDVMGAVEGVAQGGLGGFIDGLDGSLQTLGQTSAGVFEQFGDWLARLAQGTTTLREGLANMFSSSAQSLRQSGFNGLLGALTGGMSSPFGGLVKGFVSGLAGFANGGEFDVGGVGGVDSQLVAFRASPNERVSITRPDQRGRQQNQTGRVQIELADGLKASFLNDAAKQSVEIMRVGIEGNNSLMRETQRRG